MKRIWMILLAAVLLVSAMGCKPGEEPSDENANHQVTINRDVRKAPLAENGTSTYQVVIPAEASECIEYAAQELTSFVFQSTQASLPIIRDSEAVTDGSQSYISIGKTTLLERADLDVDYHRMNLDGFFIRSVGNTFFIDGDLERGTLYGVYDFLERFVGVRFLTSDCTHVPTHTRIDLFETEILEIPDFAVRLYLNYDSFHNLGTQEFTARTRQDSSYLQTTDPKYGEPTSIYARGLKDHNMRFFVDEAIYNDPNKPETYHPEFFVHHPEFETTLCLTNGITDEATLNTEMDLSVAKIVIEEMKKDIAAHPTSRYFIFEQEDGQTFCTCERCNAVAEKYQRSGLLVRFLNVVNREIQAWLKETDPDREVNLVTFAYSYTLNPPVVIEDGVGRPVDDTVIADKNVVIRTAFAYNVCYPYSSEKQYLDLVNNIKYWGLCADTFFYWVHDKDFYDYLSYFPSMKHIKKNVQDMKDYGVVYAFLQGAQNAPGDWQSFLRGYLYRNLLWNSDLDMEALTQEFLTLYWGETAAPYVQKFIDLYDYNYEIALQKDPTLIIYTLQDKYIDPNAGFITLDFLNNMIGLIEEAEQAVRENEAYSYEEKETYLKRLASCKATPYGTLYRNYAKFLPAASAEETYAFYQEFYDLIDYAGITHWSETRPFSLYREG